MSNDALGPCWNWPWAKTEAGYGVFNRRGKVLYAHRAQAERTTGQKLGPKDVVRHACDNPACMRPNHLVVGTQAQNAKDMAERNRGTSGVRNRHAKLTEAQVVEIRNRQGRVCEIAREFGVSHSIVSTIRSGKNWRHVR
jgi:hypothetical protein